ncbi:Endonuclease/Exonuclease/phosphatase family protein [Aquisphaera giovannonii]|uniref:Endonuclease/Exonuclease/phosphatase family protein n=1 Tax=Aquisphaera giovannonii TaxID=406548 RepID=A0A5B9WEC0_9BACT|nr:endonuclease/exonuclease/phosphatase family protein [Aquisphaera giovannonii]QEH38579.1 Endonuclease/Exonuclease/phosphatase family protein [Aquisphaera giovannonii]
MSDMGPLRYRIVDGVATPVPEKPRPSPAQLARAATRIACWTYAAVMVGSWALSRFSPASSWPVHMLLYGPIWVTALPAAALVPLAAWARQRWSAAALALALLGFLGVSGFNVPWDALLGASPAEHSRTLRILTCNVQRRDLKVEALAELVRRERPDVICLQDSRLREPIAALGLEGWHARVSGEFGLVSRYPIEGFEELRPPDEPGRLVAVRARLARPEGVVPIVVVRLMTPRRGLAPIAKRDVAGLAAFRDVAEIQRLESGLLRRWVENATGAFVIAGDFNLTAEQPPFRRDWSMYRDAFQWSGWGFGHTMFGSVMRLPVGVRIDHVLCGPAWRPRRSAIGPDVGSEHRPLIADLVEDL